jgi:hypothetical protein
VELIHSECIFILNLIWAVIILFDFFFNIIWD